MTAGPTALYDVDPDRVAMLVLSCPAVTRLSGGPSGAAATYLPGRKVNGIRLDGQSVELHVVVRFGVPVAEVVAQIRQRLAGQVGLRRVDIVVEDVGDPPGVESASPGPGEPSRQVPTGQ